MKKLQIKLTFIVPEDTTEGLDAVFKTIMISTTKFLQSKLRDIHPISCEAGYSESFDDIPAELRELCSKLADIDPDMPDELKHLINMILEDEK